MALNEILTNQFQAEIAGTVNYEQLNKNIVPPTSTSVVTNIMMGPNSTRIVCPHCFCRISTVVHRKTTIKTHLMCVLLTCTWCLCCLPYCMDSCRNADHYCPVCDTYLGTYYA